MGGEGKVEGEEERRREGLRRTRGNRIVEIGGKQTESKENDILIEGAIMGIARNLPLEKFPGIQQG